MDFPYIKKIVEAVNSTSEIKFDVELSQFGNLGFTSEPNRALVKIGSSAETIIYLHLFGWREVVHLYLVQNEFAENGMYSCANEAISKLLRELNSLKSLKMKIKSIRDSTQLNSLTLVTLFHEFGHIAFCHSSAVKDDYFNVVDRYIKINPVQEVLKGMAELFKNDETSVFKHGIEDFDTIEEIASDFFAIDQIFKLNSILNLGKETVVKFCFAMMNALTFSYRITAFKYYVNNKEKQFIFERLPQFCYRRMLIFDRMRDVLFNEFDIDNERFGAECERINIEIDEIAAIKQFCHEIFELTSTFDPFIKDPQKGTYYRNLKILNSNFSSNLYPL